MEIRQEFEKEYQMKIGAATYIVAAHFDSSRESLPEKITNLLKSEVEMKIAQLHVSS